MLNIKIAHISMSGNLPITQCIYLGRGRSNKIYPLLANQYTHKDNTLAKYKVDTVEEAVIAFNNDITSRLKKGDKMLQVQMRALYERVVRLSKNGTVYLQCWCRHEEDLKPWHHACHCESLRKIILTKYKNENV